jgi:hypothetical protein
MQAGAEDSNTRQHMHKARSWIKVCSWVTSLVRDSVFWGSARRPRARHARAFSSNPTDVRCGFDVVSPAGIGAKPAWLHACGLVGG